jgi:hypothetical protein
MPELDSEFLLIQFCLAPENERGLVMKLVVIIAASLLFASSAFAKDSTKKKKIPEQQPQAQIQAVPSAPAVNTLLTTDENNLSINISNYAYNEPSIGVTFQGYKGGLDYYRTQKLSNDYFVLGQINYFNGPVNYTGEVSASNIPEYYIESKLGIGKDFPLSDVVISPYIGIGYRYLFETLSNVTNGYDRQSQYVYLPIGFINRINVGANAKVETTIEYDQLIAGYQLSRLSQFNSTYSDINNNQRSGYGIKASIIYKKDNWGVGPYYKYWNISTSDTQTLYVSGVASGYAYEPANVTNEYGIKFTYSF